MKKSEKALTRKDLFREEEREARTEAVASLKSAIHDLFEIMDDLESAGDNDTARRIEAVQDRIENALGYISDYCKEGGRS